MPGLRGKNPFDNRGVASAIKLNSGAHSSAWLQVSQRRIHCWDRGRPVRIELRLVMQSAVNSLISTWLQPGEFSTRDNLKPFKTVSFDPNPLITALKRRC
jgi:hypothetical protein